MLPRIRSGLIAAAAGLAVLVPNAAFAATVQPAHTHDTYPSTQWRVHHVGHSYQRVGPHRVCVYFSPQPAPQHPSCQISTTITTGVSGQVGVSDGTLSDAVGYNVSVSTSVSSSNSFDVRRHRRGYVWWAPQYRSNHVTTRKYMCWNPGNQCYPQDHYLHGRTSRYEAPTYGVHYKRRGSR